MRNKYKRGMKFSKTAGKFRMLKLFFGKSVHVCQKSYF